MPVEQPVLDTNYKHLKIIRTWPKTTMIKTIISIASIVAYRGGNNIKCLREKNKQKTKQLNRAFITKKHVTRLKKLSEDKGSCKLRRNLILYISRKER